MKKVRISDSQQLIVFFGGINIVGPKLEEYESSTEETAPSKFLDITKARIEELRARIVDVLNKSGEVGDIFDVFKETLPFEYFNPIIFTIHLPISLQNPGYRLEPNYAEVEDFMVLYDGGIVMVSAVCSLEQRPWGVYDVRDRLGATLREIVPDLETTPPCLTHEAIAFVNKPEEVNQRPRDSYLKIESKKMAIENLRDLYLRLRLGLNSFYSACEISEETQDVAWEINEYETELLSNLKDFLGTTWRNPIKRTEIINRIKVQETKILENLSKHSSLMRRLKEKHSGIKEHRAHNDLLDVFLEKVGEEYTKPEVVDPKSLIRIIEHARSETETYSSFISTLISTLIGAIIGSALTICISYAFGLL